MHSTSKEAKQLKEQEAEESVIRTSQEAHAETCKRLDHILTYLEMESLDTRLNRTIGIKNSFCSDCNHCDVIDCVCGDGCEC